MTLNHLIAIFETDASEHSVGDEFAEAEVRFFFYAVRAVADLCYFPQYSKGLLSISNKREPAIPDRIPP